MATTMQVSGKKAAKTGKKTLRIDAAKVRSLDVAEALGDLDFSNANSERPPNAYIFGNEERPPTGHICGARTKR